MRSSKTEQKNREKRNPMVERPQAVSHPMCADVHVFQTSVGKLLGEFFVEGAL